ncbi:hypothetical protein H6P81_018818 [Aristolochia fimbriata]|uniref:Bromo domain-containing protein n=1 Tax=Aristolochia fimbriata TaxID=158543 RepID=A0AAV7E3A4_ARIFI|nr:hypothetical protein H6P81_018818 [Aristolochia fimbriata]
MGKVVEKKKKKKGRPSLLDLQKRSLRQQQEQQLEQLGKNPNSDTGKPNSQNPNPPTHRRHTRRNPNPEAVGDGRNGDEDDDDDDDDDDDEENNGKRREKKLTLVLRLPQKADNSQSAGRSGSEAGDDSDGDEDENGETPLKRRKINAVGVVDGSGEFSETERQIAAAKATDSRPVAPSVNGPTTPLPDKKLLIFILDRLQKKDSYGVFSEPVDPNELPDYHEVIEHPMDFGTVRNKLSSGAYANLEQFEADVFLICSNAMRYNAPDTIYFRQARSIQELAKKNFENLRQDSEDNEPELKVVRRGRPPGKTSIKRQLGRPPADRASSDFSSDATLATAGDNKSNSLYDLRRGSDKPSFGDTSTKSNRGGETFGGDHKFEGNDDFPGSLLKSVSKLGKKQFIFDENRRNTYKQSLQSLSAREPSVLSTFDGERRQLMPVGFGFHTEHAYARSLARFAANLGPTAWRVASRKIEKALPPGTKFGPGWVGENEAPNQSLQPSLASSSLTGAPPVGSPPIGSSPEPPSKARLLACSTVQHEGNKQPEKQEPSSSMSAAEANMTRTPMSTTRTSIGGSSSDSAEIPKNLRGKIFDSGFNLLNSSSGVRPKPPFQLHQNSQVHSPINGFSPGFGFNLSQVGKMIRPVGTNANNFSLETSSASGMLDMVNRRANSFVHSMPTSRVDTEGPRLVGATMPSARVEAEGTKVVGSSSSVNSAGSSATAPHDVHPVGSGLLPHQQPSWRGGLSLHPNADSVPPDLNVRFQSPGSPSSGAVKVDSQHPDLVLQL